LPHLSGDQKENRARFCTTFTPIYAPEKSITPCSGLPTTSNIPPSYPSHFSPQAYHNNQIQPPPYYQSYHYATTNHAQPSSTPQITYHSLVPQIKYPMPNNTSPQVKIKTNPPPYPPPPPQIQEPPQQTDAFPTHGTILIITGGSNTDFDTKRQDCYYYRQVNRVAIECPITQTKWSHMPITFSSQDVKLAWFPTQTPWSSPSTSIDGTSPKSLSIMVAKLKSYSSQPSTKWVLIKGSSKNR
jgi:hypothetical protein